MCKQSGWSQQQNNKVKGLNEAWFYKKDFIAALQQLTP